MATEINVPTLGESVTSATVGRWMKHEGEAVAADEPLVELETDKVTVEVTAPAAGVLSAIVAPEGSEVPVGALLATLEAGAGQAARPAQSASAPAPRLHLRLHRSRAPPPIRRPACIRRRDRWVPSRARRHRRRGRRSNFR